MKTKKPLFDSAAEYLHAAYSDAIVEGLPIETVTIAYEESKGNAEAFFHAIQGAVQLNDLVEDRKHRSVRR